MAKPTQAQFEAKRVEIEGISSTVEELQRLSGKVGTLLTEMSWAEIPDAVYDRIFTKYTSLKNELKTKVTNL